MNTMQKILLGITFVIALVSVGVAFAKEAPREMKVNVDVLSGLNLAAPTGSDEKRYLGIQNEKTFKLSDLKADTIMVQIFSMYCPICQAEAPHVNQLFELIQSNPQLKDRVKFLGIGTGNTPFEVDVFRNKYDVKFPLLPDDGFAVQKAFSENVRTPTFLSLSNKAGNLKLNAMHIGAVKDPGELLQKLLPKGGK